MLIAAIVTLSGTMWDAAAAFATSTCSDLCEPRQVLNSGTNGIDGYIYATATTTVADPNHIAEWIGLTYPINGDNGNVSWVQLGQYQGHVDGYSSNTVVHGYMEWNRCGSSVVSGEAGGIDTGVVPSNYAFYAYWTGEKTWMSCDEYGNVAEYGFYLSQGGLYNQATIKRYMRSSWGFATVALEAKCVQYCLDMINPTYFGVDDSYNASLSRGVHTYTYATNAWSDWTDSRTYWVVPTGTVFVNLANYYSAYSI